MPQYQYKCTSENCSNETTINCKMSEMKSTIICEECQSKMTRKVENMVAGYQCNCSGFYGRTSK